jgi:hypothetical protein
VDGKYQPGANRYPRDGLEGNEVKTSLPFATKGERPQYP